MVAFEFLFWKCTAEQEEGVTTEKKRAFFKLDISSRTRTDLLLPEGPGAEDKLDTGQGSGAS